MRGKLSRVNIEGFGAHHCFLSLGGEHALLMFAPFHMFQHHHLGLGLNLLSLFILFYMSIF